MVAPALITALATALPPLIGALPQYMRNRQENNELELLRTQLRYLDDLVTKADERTTEFQQRMTEQQNQIIQGLIAFAQQYTQQLAALRVPSIPALPQQSAAQQIQQQQVTEQRIQRVVVDARQDLEPRLPDAAQLVPREEVLDALTRLVGWQMTATTYQTWNTNNRVEGGWSILGYYANHSLYFIAVSGSDPSSAQLRSYRCGCERNPYNEVEWQMALATGVQNLAKFESLPGTGIYDLATRLGQKYSDS